MDESTDDFDKIIKKKNCKRPSRKIEFTWSEKEESKLILAVQKQRPLWDCSVPEYKLAHKKLDCWQAVAEELQIDINFSEARKKWNSMRSNFKVFLRKNRTKKSGQGADEYKNIKYPHFNELSFIESLEVEQSTKTTSTLDMDNSTTDASILGNFEEVIIPSTVGQRKKRSRTIIETPSPPLSAVKTIAAEVLTNFQNRTQPDRFTAIGEVFAGHLRNLEPNAAINLESRLFNVLYDFLGSRTSSTVVPPPTNID